MPSSKYKVGAIASKPDPKDFMYAKVAAIGKQPKEFSIRTSLTTPVKNQGRFGSCVGQASSGVMETHISAKGNAMSALFVYSLCKTLDGIPNQEGTYPKIAMQVLQKFGDCKESTMPYSLLTQPTTFPVPSSTAKAEAQGFRVSAYAKVTTLIEMRQALLSEGGVLGAVYVCENFYDPEGGKYIPTPAGTMLGGHAMLVTGYDDDMTFTYKSGKVCKGFLELKNSWGDSWGDKGYCYIPYDFFNGHSDIGMPYWMESWSSVDVMLPPNGAEMIVLTIGSNTAFVDGVEVLLDQPAFIDPKSGRTVVPLRLLSENMGYRVRWDGINKMITLTK